MRSHGDAAAISFDVHFLVRQPSLPADDGHAVEPLTRIGFADVGQPTRDRRFTNPVDVRLSAAYGDFRHVLA